MRRLLSLLYFIWAAVVFLISMILVLPFIIGSTLIFKHKKAHNTAFIFIRLWAWVFSTFSLFFFRIRNKQYRDKSKAYIYVANHNSFLDSVALVRTLSQSFKPLGKIEMAKTPIFGLIYKKIVVMIDRSSKESRERCVHELKQELEKGQSILIFPEGTMNKTNKLVADFYDGAFRIAIETQTPLAPVVLINTRQLLPRKNPFTNIRPGRAIVVFTEPIHVTGLTVEDIPDLKARIHGKMEQLIVANS